MLDCRQEIQRYPDNAMPHTLTIDLPPSFTLPPDMANDQRALRNALAVALYRQGRITPVQARGLMGASSKTASRTMALP